MFGPNAAQNAAQQADEARRRNQAAMGFQPAQQNYGAQIGGAATGQAQVGQQQRSLGQALAARARGEGPSIAEQQLQRTTQSQAAQIAAQLGAQRGVSPAMAARQAAMTGAAMQQSAAGQGAMLRAQEQTQAQQLLAQHLAQQRGQDIQMYGTAGQLAHGQNALGVQQQQLAMQDQWNRDRLAADLQQRDQEAWMNLWSGVAGGVLNAGGAALAGILGAASGGEIPGRARRPGDHPDNDTVPAMLSPGEVVLPRSVAQAPDAPERARDFVAALRARRQGGL